jgi:membrane protein DedA with SNARE-associated domain
MFENILSDISHLTPLLLYVVLFFASFIENVFPPSPSDFVVVVGGSLVATGTISFIPTLLITTAGSVLGFMTLYLIGSQIDRKILHAGKIKFISIESLERVESWFVKYGYGIILANRFMPGTRSVISFFSGLSELNVKKTIIYASVSALLWNSVIVYLGFIFGNNLAIVDKYLSTYRNIGIVATAAIILFFVIRYFVKKRSKST